MLPRLLALLAALHGSSALAADAPMFRSELNAPLFFGSASAPIEEEEEGDEITSILLSETPSFAAAQVGGQWSHDFKNDVVVVGGSAADLDWSIDAPPPGLSFQSTGILSGSPTEEGPFDFVLSASADDAGNEKSYRIVIEGVPGAVDQIVGSYDFLCALIDGRVTCWGENGMGQLGFGDNTDRMAPGEYIGGLEGVTRLWSGQAHVCAKNSEGIRCWGMNSSGQLGYGDLTNRNAPGNPIPLLADAVDLHLGLGGSCASYATGIRCWGENGQGQLGHGNTTDTASPGALIGLSNVTHMALALQHTCAVASGKVYCWGGNTTGYLGYGDTKVRNKPGSALPGLSNVSSIGAGYQNVCTLSDGAVHCWGIGSRGQLGQGDLANHTSPALVQQLGTASSLRVGRYHVCATTSAGLRCWGQNNFGIAGHISPNMTVPSEPLSNLVGDIAFGDIKYAYNECVHDDEGLKCWGDNRYRFPWDGNMTIPVLVDIPKP